MEVKMNHQRWGTIFVKKRLYCQVTNKCTLVPRQKSIHDNSLYSLLIMAKQLASRTGKEDLSSLNYFLFLLFYSLWTIFWYCRAVWYYIVLNLNTLKIKYKNNFLLSLYISLLFIFTNLGRKRQDVLFPLLILFSK